MTESFPRQEARTRRFTLGVPRAFRIAPDGTRLTYLRTQGGGDPVTCLWTLDVGHGPERLVADPRTLGGDEEDLPPQERARRERVREQAGGIVAYATDADLAVAVFSWSGRVYAVDLTRPDADPYEVPVPAPALDPRPDPAGKRLAYVCAGALRVASLADPTEDQVLADPQGAPNVTFGLAEFIAAEEMDRHHGYWWSPDGSALLVARVDETPVTRWHIADPAHPERQAAEVAYPAAGTPNAEVSLLLARLDGTTVDVDTDRAAFPYLVTVCWEGEHDPLVVVQSRDQRRMRMLCVDAGEVAGPGCCARTPTRTGWTSSRRPGLDADGRVVWAGDCGTPAAAGRRARVVGPGGRPRHPAGPAGARRPRGRRRHRPVPGLRRPHRVGLWSYGPHGLNRSARAAASRQAPGRGTTIVLQPPLDHDGVTVRVYRDGSRSPTSPRWPNGRRCPLPGRLCSAPGPDPHRRAVPVLAPARAAEAAGAARPLRRPARAAGAEGPRAYLTSQWFAEQGFAVVIADGRGTPGRGPTGNARWPATWPDRSCRTRSTRWRRRGPLRRPRHRPGRDPRLVVRRLPGRAGGAAPPRRVPRGDRGRAGHRLAPVRHPLHRALPGLPDRDDEAYERSSPDFSAGPEGRSPPPPAQGEAVRPRLPHDR